MTALIAAIEAGQFEEARRLLNDKSQNFNINEQDSHGNTALHWAVIQNNLGTVEQLLLQGADADLSDESRWTPLHHAVFKEYNDIVVKLLQARADINSRQINGYTPLHFAVFSNNADIVKILLLGGADRDLVDNSNQTALELAKARNEQDIISLFENALKQESSIEQDDLPPETEGGKELHEAHQTIKSFDENSARTAEPVVDEIAAANKKAALVKKLKIGGIAVLALIGTGALVIGIGALAGWGVMVGLLSFAPWLAIAAAAIGGVAVAGVAVYAGVQLAKQLNQAKLVDDLKHDKIDHQPVISNKPVESSSLLTPVSNYMSWLFSSCCHRDKGAEPKPAEPTASI